MRIDFSIYYQPKPKQLIAHNAELSICSLEGL